MLRNFSSQAGANPCANPGVNQGFNLGVKLSLGLVGLALLAGCASSTGIAPATARLRDAPSLGLQGQAAPVASQWWRGWGDAQLNALMDRALAEAPSLRLASARIARAEAAAGVADAARLPRLNAGFDAERQLFTKNGLYPPPLAGGIYNNATLQLSAGWELDFFGKHQAALDAALGSARAAQADAQAARVLLTSKLASAWVQWARVQAQTEITQRNLAQREAILALVRQRQQAGLDTRLELRQSEGGLPEARQQLAALQEQAQWARHAIAALVGDPGMADALQAPVLAVLPRPQPLASLPANLLAQRADIAAARWRVEAASSEAVNAKTQFYPNINLMAFAGLSSIGLGRLHEPSSAQWGFGPAISLPLFDAGRLRANLRGKLAELDAAVESYNAAVIDAVREATDQAASSQSIVQQQAQQQQSQHAAQDTYEIAQQRYRAGVGNYLQVLFSESAVLAQQRQGVDLAARALDTQVALLRALGGGYPGDAPPQARTTSTTSTASTSTHTVSRAAPIFSESTP